MAVKVSSKGWVVIPKELRDKYGIKPGGRVAFVETGGHLAVVPLSDDPIAALSGMFASDDGESWTQKLAEEHRMEFEREEAKSARRLRP